MSAIISELAPATGSQTMLAAKASTERFAAMLSIDNLNFDLYEGTVVDTSDTRNIFLGSDILRGIHAALSYEAGDAWKIVMYRCGFLWGQKTLRYFVRQSQGAFGAKFEQISVDAFLSNLVTFMNFNGWGLLSFDLTRATTHGVIRLELRKSIFSEALDHLRERVDFMVAGMLAGIFSDLSQAELACIEVCSALTGAPTSVFLLSARERIEALREPLNGGADEQELLEQLCG
jgi:uncharacterized protein